MMLSRKLLPAIAAIAACLIALGLASDFLVDWTWFFSLGFLGVFWKIIGMKIALFAVIFVATAIAIWANGALASRFAGPRAYLRPVSMPWQSLGGEQLPAVIERLVPYLLKRRLVAGISVVVAAFVAFGWTANWNLALNYIDQVPYGQSDPLFGNDFSFYLFSLPAFLALKGWMLLVLTLSALVAALIYWACGEIAFDARRRFVSAAAIVHGSILLGFFFAIEAWSFTLDRYLLLYGNNGVVVGASYTDIHVELPILVALVALCCAASIASFANARLRSVKLPLALLALVLGTSFVLSPVATMLFQRLFVKPNELHLESTYIARNIALTREA